MPGDAGIWKPCSYDDQGQIYSSYALRVSVQQVVSITKTQRNVFYDIAVPGVEHYFAEGAIHHNSTGKTNVSGWEYLLEYYCSPDDTLVLVSSTDIRGLELRVWGEIKMLHESAKTKFPWLPGYLIDSKHCITTDELDESDAEEKLKARDLRKGVIGIPTVQGGKNIGLGKWQGIKQTHMRLIADDVTAMAHVFLSAFANLNNNADFQAIVCFNPDDVLDPGGIAAEPKDGWTAHYEPTKTAVWDTKFYNGRCINYVGTDSPNFDDPNQPERYRYLVSPRKIKETEQAFGADSFEYYSQCVGVMKISQMSRRVLTRDLVKQFHAQDDCVWDGEPMRIGALDAAYGGDRAIAGYIEFGKCVDGKIRIHSGTPEIVPVKVRTDAPMDAEGQIAVWVKQYFEANGVAPENFFHDSTGRGSLGTALARVWSALCNPVEFGGSPTSRIVSADLFWTDPKTNLRRLKLCNEHYSKFVSELWFAVRYGIEADQIRGMMSDVVDEFCMRQWARVKDDKLEVESKTEMKIRTRKSPDLADWFCICVEGARRRGFIISKLGGNSTEKRKPDWLDKQTKDFQTLLKDRQLQEA